MTLVRVRLYVSLEVFILVERGMAGWGSELFLFRMEEERGTNHDDEPRRRKTKTRPHAACVDDRIETERERRCGVS